MKVGDTRPYLRVTITDQDGSAVDITDATIKFYMVTDDNDRTVTVDEGTVTLVTPASGIAEYRWNAEDTATAGNYLGEFVVTLSDATIFTIPNDDSLKIQIKEDYD